MKRQYRVFDKKYGWIDDFFIDSEGCVFEQDYYGDLERLKEDDVVVQHSIGLADVYGIPLFVGDIFNNIVDGVTDPEPFEVRVTKHRYGVDIHIEYKAVALRSGEVCEFTDTFEIVDNIFNKPFYGYSRENI